MCHCVINFFFMKEYDRSKFVADGSAYGDLANEGVILTNNENWR